MQNAKHVFGGWLDFSGVGEATRPSSAHPCSRPFKPRELFTLYTC